MLRQQFRMKKRQHSILKAVLKVSKEAINWLHEQYETRRGEWDTAPALLECRTAAVIAWNNGGIKRFKTPWGCSQPGCILLSEMKILLIPQK